MYIISAGVIYDGRIEFKNVQSSSYTPLPNSNSTRLKSVLITKVNHKMMTKFSP